MLKVCGLSQRYGSNRALNTLNLHLAQGEIVCQLGAYATDKTTALHFIAASAGVANIGGVIASRATRQVRQGAYAFKTSHLLTLPMAGQRS